VRAFDKEQLYDNLSRGRVTASDSVIVTLATAWGSKFGGINAFNTEIVKSLGILPTRHYGLICIVPGAATQALQEELRLRFHIELLALDAVEGRFSSGSASEILNRLGAANEPHRFIWIGHDDKTGPLALQLRSLATGSHAILINHMAHGAYQAVKKGSSLGAAEKTQLQRELFSEADLCFAVGPMLRSHLHDLLACVPKSPPIEMVVPGLTDPSDYGASIRDTAPDNFVAFMAGRLDQGDERIKQGRLGLRGFGRAVHEAAPDSPIRRSPTLRLRGIHAAEEPALRNLLMQEAGGAVNFDFQDYTEDRTAYFRDLASASVAMMPSWHDGFGLTAWEAIASAVPVVIGRACGVYRLLDENCSGAGLGQSVAHIHVDGWLPSDDEELNHTSEDVSRVAGVLLELAQRTTTKRQALTLRRNLLALGLDWKGAARGLVEATEKNFGALLSAERRPRTWVPAVTQTETSSPVPEWLRMPARREWRPDLHLPTSMLLAAHDEIVRFDPERENVLSHMRDWACRPNDLLVRLLYGPGGMGKTRLALELARRLEQNGWLSIWLSSTPPVDWAESWRDVLLTRGGEPILFVIDYADARPDEALAALSPALERLRACGNSAPLRLLMLARSPSWLDKLPHNPKCAQDLAAWLSVPKAIEPQALPPWSNDTETRMASYRLALDDYAAATGIATPLNAYVPCLSERQFDRPLYLHLAALAALEGQRPEGADALLRDQLQREWRYWCAIHGSAIADYDDWSDAMAYVILRQGIDTDQLRGALKELGVCAPDLAVALQRSYPAVDRIAALEPDLIAEALLRERLAEHRGSALLDAVMAAPIDQILLTTFPVIVRLGAKAHALDNDQVAEWAKVLLAAVARHWKPLRYEWRTILHRSEPAVQELLFAAWQLLDEGLEVDARGSPRGRGVIKKKTDKGFGFITVYQHDKDIFFHSKSLRGVQFADLHEGDAVTFSIETTLKGQNAISVVRT
jgi:cold shock CspA family protein/glycosyltransferase involved in cell wall biosynthesis